MFIYSVRASTVRFFTVIVLVLVLLAVAVGIGSGESVYVSGNADGVNFGGMKTNADRVAFIESFGIDVVDEPKEEKSFTMPESFDRVILGYNELQREQGLDLSKYTRKKVTRYTYSVADSGAEGVYVNLLVYRSKVVACDVSCGGEDGFVMPLVGLDKAELMARCGKNE